MSHFTKARLFCLALVLLMISPPAVSSEEVLMPVPYIQIDHPEWSRDAVIYQINTRQFTPRALSRLPLRSCRV